MLYRVNHVFGYDKVFHVDTWQDIRNLLDTVGHDWSLHSWHSSVDPMSAVYSLSIEGGSYDEVLFMADSAFDAARIECEHDFEDYDPMTDFPHRWDSPFAFLHRDLAEFDRQLTLDKESSNA